MKIISYNIAKCTQNKIDLVLCMGADLYILPECAEHKRIVLPKGYTMLWAGDEDMPQKDLELFGKNPYLSMSPKSIEKSSTIYL